MDIKCTTPRVRAVSAIPLPPVRRCFFAGAGWAWTRGLKARNPDAMGIGSVHEGVDSRGLLADPRHRARLGQDAALVALGRQAGPAGCDLELDGRQRLGGVRRIVA